MPATPRIISGESEEERKRRIAIFLMLRRKAEGLDEKPPRRTTLAQESELWKIREARREARRG